MYSNSSDTDNENDDMCTIKKLPAKTRKRYETVYKAFMDWRQLNSFDSFSENVLLSYFDELSERYKSSSLWVTFSMLRSTIFKNHNIKIENYIKLRAFLKRKAKGYQKKKARGFTAEEVKKFIYEAPDHIYLATKVALIMGTMGGCRTSELRAMNIEDIEDLGSALLVTVPDSKLKNVRKFVVADRFYEICKQYASLRPHTPCSSYFLNYQSGRCTLQNIGKNKFGAMGKQIASFLKLPNPELYTGHCFRKSSTNRYMCSNMLQKSQQWECTPVQQVYLKNTNEVNNTNTNEAINGITSLTTNDVEWKFPALAEENTNYSKQKEVKLEAVDDITEDEWKFPTISEEDSEKNTVEIGETVCDSMKDSSTSYKTLTNATINLESSGLPPIRFINCSNITINLITNKCDKQK